MSSTEEKVNKEEEISEQEEQEVQQQQQKGDGQESRYEHLDRKELIDLLEKRDEKMEELQGQVDELKESHLRRAAELENIKKRIKKERAQVFESAKIRALEDFLAINDDFRRTIKAFEDMDVDDDFFKGILMIANKFEQVLKDHGVERIDEEMVPFDVELHDAMMRQKPDDENIDSDQVLKVVENGYKIGDRTIRHAKVIVSE